MELAEEAKIKAEEVTKYVELIEDTKYHNIF